MNPKLKCRCGVAATVTIPDARRKPLCEISDRQRKAIKGVRELITSLQAIRRKAAKALLIYEELTLLRPAQLITRGWVTLPEKTTLAYIERAMDMQLKDYNTLLTRPRINMRQRTKHRKKNFRIFHIKERS